MSDRYKKDQPEGGLARGRNFFRGLISLARIALFALVFAGVLNAASKAFHAASVARSTGAATGSVRLSMALIAGAAVLMLVVTIMAGYPFRRVLPMRTALLLAAPAFVVGVVAVALAYGVGRKFGAVALGTLLLPLLACAFSLVLAWAAPPRPQRPMGGRR